MAQMWEVVGGADKGGILVREGQETTSKQAAERLSTGALIEEIELVGERLHYKVVEGTGPEEGWISIKLPGKDLAVKTDKKPRAPKPTAVGPKGEEPLPIALLFPGQGSQTVGMLGEDQNNPVVKDMLEKSKAILGYDILKICLEGPESKLEETKYCQPAMFIGGLAALEKLRAEREEAVTRAACVAGFSLGEYTALCAAGVFSFEDGLKLVKLRGEAMQEAAEGPGARKGIMVSIAGLTKAKVEELCERALKKEPDGVASISNELFGTGYTCGGTEKAIKELEGLATNFNALQAKIIKTGGAFHTALMQPAQVKLNAALDETLPKMNSPKHTVWFNCDAEPLRPGCDPKDIVEKLKKQLTSTVRWDTQIQEVIKEGNTELYEVGPGKQLKTMVKRIEGAMPVWKAMKNIGV